MKAFYLTGSIILTVLVLILAFGNVTATCNQLHFFFFPVQSNPTIVILTVAVIGVLTGIFYHAFLARILESDEEDESFE